MKQRIENVLDGSEKQAGLILEISVDGGRIRMKEEIVKKNKKRKKGSFKGQWREPILFTIRVLNPKGELLQEVPQLMDATMGNWESVAYAALKKAGHPIGSGSVESAIRRVLFTLSILNGSLECERKVS